MKGKTKLVRFRALFVIELSKSHLLIRSSLSLDDGATLALPLNSSGIESDRLLIDLFFHSE